MHTHFSAVTAAGVFLSVLIFGTAWRLGAAWLASSGNPRLKAVGGAMSFQY